MAIYTKQGDHGKTDLIGKRVDKTDPRIEFNGIVDQLSAMISFSKFYITDVTIRSFLDRSYKHLSLISYEIASDKYQIDQSYLDEIEKDIDKYERELPVLKEFIFFDQNQGAAMLNIIRTVIRKAELVLVLISQSFQINSFSLKYINRISDFFFIMARKLEKK